MAQSETHYTLPLPEFDRPVKVLIVVAPYYKDIVDQLVLGAQTAIEAAGAMHETVEVPGALEVPQAIALAHRLSNFDGYVALGCVIRGETTHYDTVCNDSSRALSLLGLQGCAIGNGILTVETKAQAEVRAEAAGQNKGGGAAEAALHLIALARRWGSPKGGLGFKPLSESYQIAGKADIA
jgi:6,7-dimethyl-8-ribityllumazine synthase